MSSRNPSLSQLRTEFNDLSTPARVSLLAGVAAELAAFIAIKESGVALTRDLIFVAFADEEARLLSGPPESWAAELAWLTAKHGITGFILAADDAETIEIFGSVVAPATRALVDAARQG